MIERQIVAQKIKEREIQEFILSYLGALSCSHIKMQRTPLGERVTVYTNKPGLIVGKKGANIKILTKMLKEKYKMENPQIEVGEIKNPDLDAATIAKSLVSGLMRFGARRFKVMSYKALENVMRAGALGVEIVVSGRGLPGERARVWRFNAGYLKKSGDVCESFVDKAIEAANLKSGTVGVNVSVLHPDTPLPDTVVIKDVEITVTEEIVKEAKKKSKKEEKTTKKVKKAKKVVKKEEKPKVMKEVKDGKDKKE